MIPKQDMALVGRFLDPQEPPERIYGWMDSHLSLARHYGGLRYQGHEYQIAYLEDRQPLVRVDVLNREAKAKINLAKSCRKAQALAAQQGQGVLL